MSDLLISRTKPIELGPQTPENSVPVIITSTEDAVLNVKQAQPETEVALSLLGIPRAETTLGVFSDVTTYGIDSEIWASYPEVWTADEQGNGHGVRFLEYMSAAKIEAPPGKYAFLNTKRAFPYLPGRVSSSTFGLRCAFENRTSISKSEFSSLTARYDTLPKKPLRKWGQYSDKNGYYFEILGAGLADDFKVVRRTNGIDIKYISANYPHISIDLPENSIYVDERGTVKRAPSGISADSLDYTHAVINDASMEVSDTTTNAVSVFDPFDNKIKLVAQENALVYEYRVPRSWFNSDQLNGKSDNSILYSDVISIDGVTHYPGELSNLTDGSVRNIEFDKVTMYKTEYSWYGAIGCIFLTYVPVFESTARWVKVHYLRGSNQLSFPTLGNPYLPMRFYVQNPIENTGIVEGIEKYGASYYIDGADKGSVKVYSALNDNSPTIYTGEIKSLGTITQWGIFNDFAYPYIKFPSNNLNDGTNRTYLNGSYILGSIAVIKNGETIEKTITPGSIYVTYVKRDSSYIYMFLNKSIFEDIDSSGVTSVLPSPVDFRFSTPRGGSVTGIKMKRFIGPSNVVSKATVFPIRCNVGNTGNNIVAIKVIKNARRPIAVGGEGNSGWGIIYNDTEDEVKIHSEVREVPLKILSKSSALFRQSENFEFTAYIRDIPGIIKVNTLENNQIYNCTFTRYEQGDEIICRTVSNVNDINSLLPIDKNDYGPDVVLQESAYLMSPNGIRRDPVTGSREDPYGNNLFNQSAETFSAINYNVSDEICPLYNTGQQLVTLLTSPNTSDDFSLTPYFGFNKEFLAGSGLSVDYRFDDTLILVANTFNPNDTTATTNIVLNITWEEQ